jgi:hypothetical protein
MSTNVCIFFRPVHHLAWLSKRVQNYNFFFNTTRKISSFFRNSFSLKLLYPCQYFNELCLFSGLQNMSVLYSHKKLYLIFFLKKFILYQWMLKCVSERNRRCSCKVVSLYTLNNAQHPFLIFFYHWFKTLKNNIVRVHGIWCFIFVEKNYLTLSDVFTFFAPVLVHSSSLRVRFQTTASLAVACFGLIMTLSLYRCWILLSHYDCVGL